MTKPLIIITGASSGIGAAIAKTFGAAGHPLLLLARRVAKMEAFGLPNTLCLKVDVTDRAQLIAAVKEGEDKFGPADAIINNAGCMLLGTLADQEPAEWDHMIDVNVKGLLNSVRAVLPAMKARRRGTIINMGSIDGRRSYTPHRVYCGTKFAVHAFSEALRAEVAADNVRVIVIAPGAVATELVSHTTSQALIDAHYEALNAPHSILDPQEIANIVLFAYQQPQTTNIRGIVVAGTGQVQ
ncbi:oxidoreductase [Pseudovibrio japonicus]|uniref:Oxidoreductase n=1 Tax=Pseudovibrio japonicus TaxID=366534 RepID=A0ABQ3EIU5_9HYPH|nr:SDR family oxidoreductase [Pseudovibrio japonicus]GHB41218.1 oxidoreductase [Pseudovibrio japonicus]